MADPFGLKGLNDVIVRRIAKDEEMSIDAAAVKVASMTAQEKVNKISFDVNSPDIKYMTQALCGDMKCVTFPTFHAISNSALLDMRNHVNKYFTIVSTTNTLNDINGTSHFTELSDTYKNAIEALSINATLKEDTEWWKWFTSSSSSSSKQQLLPQFPESMAGISSTDNLIKFIIGLRKYTSTANMIPASYIITQMRSILSPEKTTAEVESGIAAFFAKCKELDRVFLAKCGLSPANFEPTQTPPVGVTYECFVHKATFGYDGFKRYIDVYLRDAEYNHLFNAVIAANLTALQQLSAPLATCIQDIARNGTYNTKRRFEEAVIEQNLEALGAICSSFTAAEQSQFDGHKRKMLRTMFDAARTTNEFPPYASLRKHFKTMNEADTSSLIMWIKFLNSQYVVSQQAPTGATRKENMQNTLKTYICNNECETNENAPKTKIFKAMKALSMDLQTNHCGALLRHLKVAKRYLALNVIVLLLFIITYTNQRPMLKTLALAFTGILFTAILVIYIVTFLRRL